MTKQGSATSIRLKNPDPSTTLTGLKSFATNSTTALLSSTAQVELCSGLVAFTHHTVEQNYPAKSDCLHFQIIPRTAFGDSFSNDSSGL